VADGGRPPSPMAIEGGVGVVGGWWLVVGGWWLVGKDP